MDVKETHKRIKDKKKTKQRLSVQSDECRYLNFVDQEFDWTHKDKNHGFYGEYL